ncbi:MAG TPA: S9 family peptidase [Ohtaekwangia sp.]|uniref:S9 family peptidase n=1 Tax=Ohtaekwangia sp. TaxID=2066019 RepID=UPI002F9224F0
MKVSFYPVALLCATTLIACGPGKETALYPDVAPPVVEKKPFEIVSKHGHKRVDDFYWLKNREDSAVIQYLKDENAYVDTMLAHTKPLQEKLFNEMKGRIKEKDESVPYRLDNYYYYTRYEEGYEYPIYCRKQGSLDAPEEIIANGNELSKGHNFFDIDTEVSPNHALASIITDTVGRRFYTLRFKDLKTGNLYPDKVGGTEGELVWFNDNKTILYVLTDPETLIGNKVYKHTLGTDPAKDELIYTEKDSTLECSVYKSKSEKYIFIASGRTDAQFMQALEADNPKAKPVIVEPLQANVKYTVDHANDKFYILTNLDASNYRLVETPVTHPGKAFWKDVIPHRDNIFIETFELFKDYLVLEETTEGLNKIRTIKWSDKSENFINFEESAYYAGLSGNPEFNTSTLRYNYQSMTTPNSVYDYDMNTHEKKLLKEKEVLGGFNKNDYQTERVMAKARDGVSIPISIVYRKDKFKKDGTNPCLQYAYGSYGISMIPFFDSQRLSLLNRGFVYAIAHIRGGQEMGGKWYEDGKMLHKKNTFTDFVDCSEYLVNEKYAAKDKLFANGGSAGGLLMGAITNMRPDLYKGVVADVPFVDVITTMMDETIPLTSFEWKEWGNPNIREEYEYMLSYSPYDNVEKKAYPNLLVTTGLHDSQVQYWEPAKWVAKLRTMKTDKNLLLFKTNMSAGHGGSSGRFQALKDEALIDAFILDLAGIKE